MALEFVTGGGGSVIEFHGELNGEDVNLLKLKFDLMLEDMEDLSPVWEIAREDMMRDVKDVFETEGASMGEKWVGLSKATIKDRKRKGFPPYPILYRTGALKNSLLGGSGGIDVVDRWGWEYGTRIPYAIYHQSRRPRRRLPRRAFLYVSNKFKGDLVKYIHKFIVTGGV